MVQASGWLFAMMAGRNGRCAGPLTGCVKWVWVDSAPASVMLFNPQNRNPVYRAEKKLVNLPGWLLVIVGVSTP